MTEVEQNVNDTAENGEEEDDDYGEEVEGDFDEDKAEKDEEKEEEEVAPVKKRRCQKRRKIRQICFDEDDQDEDEGLFPDGEEEDDDAEGEEESETASFTSSVLSAISFVWENNVYEFEELCDPGNIETVIVKPQSVAALHDDTGVLRYLEVCKSLNITPMIRILHSLTLGDMDLSNCNIDSKSIKAMCAALETNNVVQRLIMKFNKLKLEDCRFLGLIFRYNEKLTELDFTGCRLGPEGLQSLIAHLTKNEFVEVLKLSKCNIQDEGLKSLVNVLVRNNAIYYLDLSYNKLAEESGEALASALKMNSCITNLILRYNNLFDPSAMKGFFRSLTANNSISNLDLSWNGLSGVEMAGYIGNYLRRNSGIQHLDLSDNRFQGLAVVELKKGLAKSRSLETLKLGKNPMSPEDLDLVLSGAKGCSQLKVLDLEDLWVKKSFIKSLNKIQQDREIEVTFAGMLQNYEVLGPDYSKIILQRAQFEAQKPKSVKKRKDFGHLMWTLGDEPMSQDEFMSRVKKFKAKISKELFPELMKQFIIARLQLIDVVAMRAKYLSLFPDSTPPPPPKPKKGQKEPVVAEEEKKEESAEQLAGELGVDAEYEEEEFILGEDEEDGEFMIGEIGDDGELYIDGAIEEAEEGEDKEELVLNETKPEGA